MVRAISSVDGNLAFVQVGVTALRDESGLFLPATPLYIAVEPSGINPSTGQSPGEAELVDNIGQVLAEKFDAYVAGCRQLERLRKEKA